MTGNGIKISLVNIFDENTSFRVDRIIYDKPSTLGPRLQTHLQLVYVHAGAIQLQRGAEPGALFSGDCVLLLPGEVCLFHFAQDQPTDHGWVDAHTTHLDPATLKGLGQLPSRIAMDDVFDRLTATADALRPRLGPRGNAVMDDLGRALFSAYLLQAGVAHLDGVPPPHPAVEKARQTIRRDYARPLTLNLIARQAGISGPHLIRLYKLHYGITPIEDLWRWRVAQGVHLLRSTGLAVAEVADRTGFSNPYHFSRMIKTHHGQSPLALRRAHWQKEAVSIE
jgi:AraC-like DNA-binding protein